MKRKLKRKIRNFVVWLTTFLVALPSLTIGGLMMAPKAMATPTSHVVISEIQIAGGVVNDEFIELYNPTANIVTMSAWRLTKKTAGGTESNLVSALNGNIPAYGYFLITPQTEYDGTTTADVTYSQTSNFLADDNTVILYSDAGATIVDKVGYSTITISDSETGPFATNPSANGSIERKPGATVPAQGNGIDSGNNASDFAARETSDPQNSSSAIEKPFPTISNFSVTPSPAKSGDVLTIQFTASTTLVATPDPNVTVGGNLATKDSVSGLTYTYKYTVVGTETEGGNIISVAITDNYSNTGTDTSNTIVLDFTAPTISSPAVSSNNATSTLAKKDDLVTATFTASDNVGGSGLVVPTVTFGAKSMACVLTTLYTCSRTLDGTETEGTAGLNISVSDLAGNTATDTSKTLTTDFTAPTNGSVIINSGATITNSNTVALTISATDAGSGLDMMMQFSNDNVTWSDWVVYATSQSTYTLTSGNGDKTVYTKFKDKAGNISSAVSANITVNSGAENAKVASIASGTQTITPTDDVSLNITATGATTLTKANYTANPQSAMESGLTAMTGKYLELAITDTSKITWPIEIKVYFTQDELTAAGISSTSQIKGLYFWDSATSKWKLYEGTDGSTGVTTPSDKANYLGYVWAKVNHFTPMLIGLDLSAPETPKNLTASVDDGSISLSWDKISDAAGYYVRYRQVGTEVYTTVYLTGVDSNSSKITGLTNGTEYEFGVAAIDAAANISSYATVKATPTPPAPTPAPPLPTTITPAVGGYHPLEKLIPKAKAAEPKEEGKVKAEETTVETRNWVRILVSLAVLIIIAGAGFAAYAIYEWWVEDKGRNGKKEEEEEIEFEIKTEKEKKKRGRKKKNNRSDRW